MRFSRQCREGSECLGPTPGTLASHLVARSRYHIHQHRCHHVERCVGNLFWLADLTTAAPWHYPRNCQRWLGSSMIPYSIQINHRWAIREPNQKERRAWPAEACPGQWPDFLEMHRAEMMSQTTRHSCDQDSRQMVHAHASVRSTDTVWATTYVWKILLFVITTTQHNNPLAGLGLPLLFCLCFHHQCMSTMGDVSHCYQSHHWRLYRSKWRMKTVHFVGFPSQSPQICTNAGMHGCSAALVQVSQSLAHCCYIVEDGEKGDRVLFQRCPVAWGLLFWW